VTQGTEAGLVAGASERRITPPGKVFLYGYPHVSRISTGVHDDLLCSALYLRHGDSATLLLANDLIFVSKQLTHHVRGEIGRRAGISPGAIAVTATHTHSGPVVVNYVSNRSDPVVPSADAAYLHWLADCMVEAGCEAVRSARPAEIGLQTVEVGGIGGNRHDPGGPADHHVPVLVVRDRVTHQPLACAVTVAIHPTVLHEDSTLVSADFPHYFREHLWQTVVPRSCALLFFNGTSGDQSPRHAVRENTFAEAARLGEHLGRSVAAAIPGIPCRGDADIRCASRTLDLERRRLPALAEATEAAATARRRFESLRAGKAARAEVRTAECDLFGAEETLELVRAERDGGLGQAAARCLPAEIQVVRIGSWTFSFWPGEFFVDYGLRVKAQSRNSVVVTLANGDLQGYIVTPEAERRGLYEAGNAVFAPANGERFVQATVELIRLLA